VEPGSVRSADIAVTKRCPASALADALTPCRGHCARARASRLWWHRHSEFRRRAPARLRELQSCVDCTFVPDQLERRERKKLATHRALATAARQLTLDRGLDAVTVDDIADAADVSPRTFFNYFSSKEQAIVGVDPTALAELAAALEGRPAEESPLEALTAVFVADLDELNEAARRWLQRTELVGRYPSLVPRHLEALVEVEHVLVRVVAARLGCDPHRDLYPTAVVAAAMATVRSTMTWWNANGRRVALADALNQAFAVLAAGLRPTVAGPLAAT
jgi:AcrR family transcriptional regulator